MIWKGITVRQPWAYAIIHAGKTIENRSWPTKLRGTVAIHAGQALDHQTIDEFFELIDQRHLWPSVSLSKAAVRNLPRSAIIGLAEVYKLREGFSTAGLKAPKC